MVNQVKRMLGVKKAGHIGTLDPIAEGILPICIGQSTRIIQFLSPLPKHYQCIMELGSTTDTQDATGRVISKKDTTGVTTDQIKGILKEFRGEQKQVPPMYSAKKNKGIPLYKLARSGITIERKPVSINFFSIEFVSREKNQVKLEVHCSAGTYIRTLCHDIGQKLGCGANMSNLVRNEIGVFNLKSSISLDDLKKASENKLLDEVLFPIEKVLTFLPELCIKDTYVKALANGRPLTKGSFKTFPSNFKPGMNLRVSNGNDAILAIVEPVVNREKFDKMNGNEIAFKSKRVLIN
jgi:tRNA pseudouridine55 synthase